MGVLPAILDKTTAASIPIYGSEIEQVKIGCVAAAGIDYYQLGIQTGAMAAKILTKQAKATELPYETIQEYSIYTNIQALEELGMVLPSSIEEKAVPVQLN